MGQELSVAGKYVRSDLQQFQSGLGGEIGLSFYNESKHRIMVSAGASYRGKDYEYSLFMDGLGTTAFRYVEPNNLDFSLAVSYDWPIVKSSFSNFYIGGVFSIDNFVFNETGTQNLLYQSSFSEYQNNMTELFNPGIGLNFEYEQKITESGTLLFFALQPTVVKYYKFNMIGNSIPALVNLVNYKIGIRFAK